MTTDHQPSSPEWLTVPGWPAYKVSKSGTVCSLRRPTPVVLKSYPGPCGFHTVALSDAGTSHRLRVGTLMAAAFLGPRPEGSEVRRLDGDPLNDRLENLAYGTIEEVHADHAARARREEAAGAPTHCPEGHRFADSWLSNWGQRFCPKCHGRATKEYQAGHYDEIREQRRTYRSTNRAELNAKSRDYYHAHRDELLPAQKQYYKKHYDKIREQQRVYYLANRERLLVQMKAYRDRKRAEKKDI